MISDAALAPYLTTALDTTHFNDLGERYQGKVRDVYIQEDKRILIATDRQSAFDISWTSIPLKGQVLTQISRWWFEQVADIMPIHMIDNPDPNVMVVTNLQMLPVEIVVRGYLTGSTKTSAWMNYNAGVRNFFGVQLPEGMIKNQPFESPIITPTTKAEDDESIDPEGIISRGLATADQWAEITEKALEVFAKGQEIAAQRGLILVDTKYEMGLDSEGNIVLADEVHTPDSSRYWVADSYEKRHAAGQEPESLDKEFFRLWLREQGFEYGKPKPDVTDEARVMLAGKYIDLYERVTGETFVLPEDADTAGRIERNLNQYRLK